MSKVKVIINEYLDLCQGARGRFGWTIVIGDSYISDRYKTFTRKSDATRGALRFMKHVAKALEQGVVFED